MVSPESMTHLNDRAHLGIRLRVTGREAIDNAAIDLDVRKGEPPKGCVAGEAGTKVIGGNLTSEFGQSGQSLSSFLVI